METKLRYRKLIFPKTVCRGLRGFSKPGRQGNPGTKMARIGLGRETTEKIKKGTKLPCTSNLGYSFEIRPMAFQ
jgi:hypothetical protein